MQGTHRWDELRDWKRSPDGSYTVRDYHSKEVDDIISSVSHKPYDCQRNQMKMLAELLDKRWEVEYKHYLAEVYDGANETSLGPAIQSSFHCSLAQRAWLPPKGVGWERVLYKGSELYDPSRHLICNLLHSHVTYIGADLKDQELVQLLQIKCTINTDDLLTLLQEWSDSLTFSTTIEHMTYVYLYLKQKSDEQQLQGLPFFSAPNINDQIKEGNLIFVPEEQSETLGIERATPGQFYSVHQVCWYDPTGVLYKKQKYNKHLPSSLPKVLQPHYGSKESQRNQEIRQAFLHFGIPDVPTTASLIALLKYISSTSPMPESYHVDDFTSVAFELANFQNRHGLPPEFIYSNLRNVKVFPTQDHKWVSLEDGLFEGDDPQLVKRFSSAEGIHFLQWPNLQSKHTGRERVWENQQCREAFIAMCKIPKLSEVAHPRITQTGFLKRSDDLQTKLYHCIPLIQRFLAKNCADKYSELKMRMKEKLQRLQVFSVLGREYIHVVEHDGREIASSAIMLRQSEFEDSDPPAIYVVASKADRLSFLLPALMKLFMSQDEEEFERFLMREVLPEEPSSGEEIEQIIRNSVYDLDASLPEEDPVWTIPLPLQQPAAEKEESEEELSDSEGEQPTDIGATTAEDPSRGLKSWPPRAAVPLEGEPGSHKTAATAGKPAAPIWPPPKSGDRSAQDVISEEEIRKVQQKHLQDYSEKKVNEGNSVVHRQSPSRQLPPHSSNDGAGVAERQLNQSDHLMSHSTPERQACNLGGMNHTTPEVTASPSQKHHHHPAIDTNPKRESTGKTFQSVEFPVVDIRSLMQKVALQDADHQLLPLMTGVDEESLMKVGRWGEEFVYTFLKAKGGLPDGRKFQSIQWVNENNESENPYDIEIEVANEKIYIEVKSTTSAHKELAAISWRELKFAEEQSGNFHLYRVYRAGKATTELCWLENLFNYLQNNPVRFFFEL